MTHADKRTVTTDALETLGQIHTRQEHRDAIHLAVEPVEAGEDLLPGVHITVQGGIARRVAAGEDGLGIVDPFLSRPVKKGERFWFVMYPRMVRSLRHVWTHPAFPDSEAAQPPVQNERAEAEAWLRRKADAFGLSYQRLLDITANWVESECEYVGGSEMEGVYIDDDFWPHYELATGKPVPDGLRHNFIGCAC